MLRIRRSEEGGLAILALSGQIGEKDLSELQRLLEGEAAEITFDLEEVRLVDRQTVRFLASCEARGIKLRNCPLYVREWMGTRSDTP